MLLKIIVQKVEIVKVIHMIVNIQINHLMIRLTRLIIIIHISKVLKWIQVDNNNDKILNSQMKIVLDNHLE